MSFEEEEDFIDSDKETGPLDLMTPSGKRILRESPVKPSTKAKEMHGQPTSRGRGNRGRGRRGGHGGEITGEFKRRCDFPIISNIVLLQRTDNVKVHLDYQRRLKRRLYSNRNRRDEDEVIK
ncbi:unnamed protein product [Brassica oleracea]